MEKWFDSTVYMQNKLAQMQATDPAYTMSQLVAAFAAAGFVGEEGYFNHFMQFGAAEEVAPNAYFNADEYYAAKAAQFYGEAFTGSELQVAQVKALIQKEGMNAWTHYQQFGSAEGVNPSNAFDASDYCAAKAEAMNAAGQKAPDGNAWTAESIAKAIDDAGMSVLEHYMTYAGTGEGEVAAGTTFPVPEDEQVVVSKPGEIVVVDGTATTYTGTAGDDTFYAVGGDEIKEYNTLDGGEGNDTLIMENQEQVGTIKNIENLVAREVDDKTYDLSVFSTSFTLDGGKATVENVTSQKLISDGDTLLTVEMAAGQTSVDLASLNRTTAEQTVVLSGDSLSSVKLAVDEGVEELNFTGSDAKVTDLAITATVSDTEDDAATVNATALDKLANVTVAGAGAVNLVVDASNSALKTVDATANTGGVEVDLSAAPEKAVFKGGAGDDELTLGDSTAAAHTLGAGDDTVAITAAPTSKDFSVDGGEGTDTLKMGADIAAEFSIGDVVKNFEILELDGSQGIVDMGDFGDINHVVVGGTLTGALTVNDVDSDGTIEFIADQTTAVTVSVTDADATGHNADVLNVTTVADGDLALATLTVNDVETINITADDTKLAAEGDEPDTHTMTLAADKAATVTVSGDANVALTLQAGVLKTIDASANTGGVQITNALGAVTFKGSTGDDSISAEALSALPATSSAVLTFDDFEAGDTISMGAAQADKLTELTVGGTDNWGAVMKSIKDGDNVWFQFGGDTYVAVSGASGFGTGSDDYLVKLSGLVDLSNATLDNGALALPEGA